MDDLGIMERGIDEDGSEYFFYIVIDGDISRIDEQYFRYINNPRTC